MEVRALAEAPVRARDPDAELVAAARDEPSAFLALYDRYFHRVLGYARMHIRDDPTCKDVTSTVFTTALAQLPRFRGRGSFGGWLFQIARNTVQDVHRERERARRPLPHAPVVSEPDGEQLLLARERAAVAGSVTIDGRSLYKIALSNGVIGYFDEHDYMPVYIDNPQDDGTVVRTRVEAYEELPATAENQKLLNLAAQHPGARIDTDPEAAPSTPQSPRKP